MKKIPILLLILCFHAAHAQWKDANYPSGGQVLSTAVKQNLIFASVNGDVFVSGDKGDQWTLANDGLPKTDSVFLCVSENKVFAATRKGIYSSLDNGTTWEASGKSLPDSINFRISYMAAKDTVIFAGAPPGRIYRSLDEGLTWEQVYSETITGTVQPIMIDNSLIFAGVYNGLVYSHDLGSSWTIAPSLPSAQPVFTMLKTKLYANFFQDLYVSLDSGKTWDVQPNDLSFGNWGIAMENDDSIMYLGTTNGLLTSADGGETWIEEIAGLPYRSYVNTFSWMNDELFMGTSKNMFYANDHGKSWTMKSNGIQRVRTHALLSNNNTLFSGCTSGLMTTSDNAATWAYKIFGVNSNAMVYHFTTVDTSVFAATGENIFESADKGETWNEKYTGLLPGDMHTTQVKGNAGKLYAPKMKEGLFRSADRGESWYSINSNLPDSIIAISVGFHGDSTIFIGTLEQGVYRSDNEGWEWAAANTGLPQAVTVNDINTQGDDIYLSTSKGLYKSTNEGLNWILVAGVPEVKINCFNKVDKFFMVGTEDDVFLSDDQGGSWRSAGHGLPAVNINTFALHDGKVYAATDHGVWYCMLNEVGVKENSSRPDIVIYPNPNNGLFSIRSGYQQIQVDVYNALGEQVYTAGFRQPNTALNLGHLAKGIYVVKAVTAQGIVTQKMIIQ